MIPRYRHIHWPLGLALLLLITACQGDAPTRDEKQPVSFDTNAGMRALIIAVAEYPEPSVNGYGRIHSDNDVPHVRSALLSQGFDSTQIQVLADAEATRAGIQQALETLIAASQRGDIVVLHFSGHGDQITDDNGDEVDGFDEVLAGYGARANAYFRQRTYGRPEAYAAAITEYATGPDFQHIRDDEMGAYVARLRQAVGPTGNVVVWIDACHSGTATRGTADPDAPQARGTEEPIGLPAANPPAADQPADVAGLFEAGTRGDASAELAPFVVFSAARQGELNWETRDDENHRIGPLSLALSRSLAAMEPGDTYAVLFEQLAERMAALAPNQTPQIEGDVHTEIFSGRVVAQPPYYRVDRPISPTQVMLAAGQLAGLTQGAGVAFYERGQNPDTPNAAPLATGTVDRANPLRARITLDAPADTAALRRSWVYATTLAVQGLDLRLHLGRALDGATRTALRAAMADLPVTWTDNPAEATLLIEAVQGKEPAPGEGHQLFLKLAQDGTLIGSPIPRPGTEAGIRGATNTIRERIRDYARNRFLQSLVLPGDEIDVELDFVPATPILDDFGDLVAPYADTTAYGAQRQGDGGNAWLLREGDSFLLQLRNTGERRAFVTVLELYPDGQIHQLFPWDDQTLDEAWLEPGQTYMRRDLVFSTTPPFGNYVIKLIATAEPVDFRPIFSARGSSRGEAPTNNPLEVLMAEVQATRSSGRTAAPSLGSTDAVRLTVLPQE